MAETREPTGAGVPAGAGVAVGPAGRPGGAADERYRPLSLLAVAGLGVVLLGAGVIAACSLVSFVRGQPWLHPAWAAVTLGGGLLCLLAWLRVRGSEGALAGDNLARWGMTLSLLVGLSYLAYYTATYLAIRQQADAVGREFLGLLAQGKTNEAFLMTQPPTSREVDASRLRQELEIRFNASDDTLRGGALSRFEQMELARLLAQGGSGLTLEPAGLASWEYAHGGYKVTDAFKVSVPALAADVYLTLQGHEGKQGEFEGRRWQVIVGESGVLPRGRKPTPLGERMGQVAQQSGQLVMEAQQKLTLGRPEDFALATLPPGQRAAVQKSYPRDLLERPALVQAGGFLAAALPGAGPGPALARAAVAADLDAVRELYLPGYRDFREGKFVRAEEGEFWAPDAARRQLMASGVRAAFRQPGRGLGMMLRTDAQAIPAMRQEGDRVVIEHDCQVMLPATRHMVEAKLVTECGAAALQTGKAQDLRLRELRLVRGKALPSNTMGIMAP